MYVRTYVNNINDRKLHNINVRISRLRNFRQIFLGRPSSISRGISPNHVHHVQLVEHYGFSPPFAGIVSRG